MATIKNIDKQLRITVSIIRRQEDDTTGPSFLNITESDIISIKGNVYYLANNVKIEIKDPFRPESELFDGAIAMEWMHGHNQLQDDGFTYVDEGNDALREIAEEVKTQAEEV